MSEIEILGNLKTSIYNKRCYPQTKMELDNLNLYSEEYNKVISIFKKYNIQLPYVLKPTLVQSADFLKAKSPSSWATARDYIEKQFEIVEQKAANNMSIHSHEYDLPNEVSDLLKNISTSGNNFSNMTLDDKLCTLNNFFEAVLKQKNGKFINVDEVYCNELVSNENIMEFKKKTQCFRHASSNDLLERRMMNDVDKKILIEYGVFLAKSLSIISGGIYEPIS